jgi:hypothetical protein
MLAMECRARATCGAVFIIVSEHSGRDGDVRASVEEVDRSAAEARSPVERHTEQPDRRSATMRVKILGEPQSDLSRAERVVGLERLEIAHEEGIAAALHGHERPDELVIRVQAASEDDG